MKLVDETQLNADLTSVANAIRAKSGTSGSIAFPSGFVSAINNISMNLIDYWDFTGESPTIGSNKGNIITTNNITFSNTGAKFNSTTSYLKFPRSTYFNNIIIELEIDSLNLPTSSTSHRRFIMGDSSQGFIYRNNSKWAFYGPKVTSSGGQWVESSETDRTFFDNSTVKVIIDSSGYWHIYKNNILWWEPDIKLDLDSSSAILYIGSYDQSVQGALIKSIKISFNN